ncbi:hypothetical protein CC2G_009877 [Coprinopsis cinerea AmutBmut pab1-1]|nr:hypothetical protein CC2G_009877 [Coprinopsis cinerea AmutBmut pab1-1]
MGALPPSDPILNNIITQNLHYWQIAATTVALYDHVSTLDLEIELIWKKKFSTVQILYLLNRYSGDALFMYVSPYSYSQQVKLILRIQPWSLVPTVVKRGGL